MNFCKLCGAMTLAILGLLLATGGGLLMAFFPKFIETKLNENLRLENGTDTFENWKNIPITITMKFNFFELSNPDTYTSLDDMKLIEKGPYVFDETRNKEEIVFYLNDKNESLVSFRERRHYKFREDLSVGSYDDNITFINLPMMGVLFNKVLTDGKFGYDLISDALSQNEKSLFTTRKVGDVLFDGVFLQLMEVFAPFMPPGTGIPIRNFSIIESRSELLDEMSVFTGIDSMNKYGEVFRSDNKYDIRNDDSNKSFVWHLHDDPSHSCNQFRGTDGTFFKPFVKSNQTLYAYAAKLCRPMLMKYLEPSEVLGISTLRYHMPKETFESPQTYRPNSCYCLEKNITDCNTNGGLEISHCLKYAGGVPAVLSQPYFLYGDQHLRDDIHLVPPKPLNLENYGTVADIEPMTGTALRGISRAQMNIKIRHLDDIPKLNATKEGKDYIIPALWFEETASLDDALAHKMKSMLFDKLKLVNLMSIGSVAMGTFLVTLAIFLMIKS